MFDAELLSAVFGKFAQSLATGLSIQRFLGHLVERIVEVLPVSGAGVTLIVPGAEPHYLVATDDWSRRVELLQTDLGQGPSRLAYESGTQVVVPELRTDGRFPRFGPPAEAVGLAAVFSFPLQWGEDGLLGALDLFRDTPGALEQRELLTAQTLAEMAGAYLLNGQACQEAQEASRRFQESSLYDSLTGLPNRALLRQRLKHAAQRAQRSHGHAAVLFVDLDRFKQINDGHGHSVGDGLLQAVARRLSGLVRPGDTLARIYGDEFVFLCEDLPSAASADALATRILGAFSTPFVPDGYEPLEVEVAASVGLAYSGDGEEISDRLILDADLAMYQAKRRGGARHQFIDPQEARRTDQRNRLRRDLKDALARHQLDLAYQPIVRTTDCQITGVEALLRWTDPHGRSVAADTTIELAEQSGLITRIGAWVLERACRDRGQWLQGSDAALELAVNVSARQLMEPGFAPSVAAVLERTAMDPAALVLEMTEGIFIDDAARAMTVLEDLKALGVRLALDDFGTGFSSLAYLRQFPVDIVKIDQQFISDLGRKAAGMVIIDAVTTLAHALDLSVTVEGIETAAQHELILAVGCEHAQGFHYARPMPGQELAAKLAAQAGRSLHLPTQRGGSGTRPMPGTST